MVVALLLMVAEPPVATALSWEQRTKIASMIWQSCNEHMAKEYAKGKDPAGDVADAAAAKCNSAGDKFEEYATQYFMEKHGWGGALAGDTARKQRDALRAAYRDKALAAAMDARTK